MKNITITVWVKNNDFAEFLKQWKYLFDAEKYYRQNDFKYNGIPLYLEKMMGDFVQLNLKVEDYLFWKIKTEK